jgi:hypothetical protein
VEKQVSGYNCRMEFFFTQPDVERLTPTNTRLLDLHAEAYPDGKRLRISMDLTPFQQNPYLELTLFDLAGEAVATTSIIEPVACRIEITLHIRKPSSITGGVYNLVATLSFPDLGEIDHRNLTIEIPSYTV